MEYGDSYFQPVEGDVEVEVRRNRYLRERAGQDGQGLAVDVVLAGGAVRGGCQGSVLEAVVDANTQSAQDSALAWAT